MKHCENCKWWLGGEDLKHFSDDIARKLAVGDGICRRFPPPSVNIDDYPCRSFTITHAYDGCGEHNREKIYGMEYVRSSKPLTDKDKASHEESFVEIIKNNNWNGARISWGESQKVTGRERIGIGDKYGSWETFFTTEVKFFAVSCEDE